jgi:hypothetical protein
VTTLQPETVRAWARNAAPAFLALYLVSNLMLRSFTDVWMFVGWTALCSGVICGGWAKGQPIVFWGVLALLFCHAAAIPGSLIWGTGNWELTAGVVLWMAPAMLLYLSTNAHQVFVWLIPAWLFHAALVIVEGLTHWYVVGDVMVRQGTNTGLTNNPIPGVIVAVGGRFTVYRVSVGDIGPGGSNRRHGVIRGHTVESPRGWNTSAAINGDRGGSDG